MKKLGKITIIGLGLIGGSMAKAVKEKRLAFSLWGLAHTPSALKKIRKMRIFDRLTLDLATAVKGADLVILAVPPAAIKEYIPKLKGKLPAASVVMDVGSVKKAIVRLGKQVLGENFVGTHPLAGAEKKGIERAYAGFFRGSMTIVIPGLSRENTRRAAAFWRSLGAKVEFMSAEKHDRIMAFTSHLPHLMAFSLAGSLPGGFLKYKAGSLRDITRVAASPAELWCDIFSDNFVNIKKAFGSFVSSAEKILDMAGEGKSRRLRGLIKKANRKAGQ